MAERIDKESNRSIRALKLIYKVTASPRGVLFENLSSDEWGDPATLRRLIKTINDAWQQTHQRSLLEIVDAQGKPTTRGERYLRLVKPDVDRAKFHDFRATRLAAFPAVFEFLKVIQHTIIADHLQPFYESLKQDLSKEDRRRLVKLEGKFVCASRSKAYKGHADVLDEVYDALLREVKLEITFSSRGSKKVDVVRPLGLIHYNSGLYLVAHFDTQKLEDEPYKFKLESLQAAESLKDQPFAYPAKFSLRDRFRGEFGIFFDAKAEPVEVELEFRADDGVKKAVKERVYTKNDKYEELTDGRLVLKFQVRGLTEVQSWVLSWGGNVRVRKPEALRRAVSEAARAMLEMNKAG